MWAQAPAPGRPIGFEWRTANADLQRTSWLRVDPNISVQSVLTPAFTLQWRETLDNTARGSASLSQGITINGMYGFSTAGNIIAGASNNIFAVDNEPVFRSGAGTSMHPCRRHSAVSRRHDWRAGASRRRSGTPTIAASDTCSTGARISQCRRPSRRRGPDGSSHVSTVAPDCARADDPAAPPAPAPATPTASALPARGGLPAPGTRYSPIYAISSAGTLHVLGPVSGIDVQRPAPFLPPNARYSDLAAVNGMLYTSTSNGCGGGANGVWAITLESRRTSAHGRPMAEAL